MCAWVCGGTRHSFVLIIRRALLSFSSSLSRLVRIVSARDVRCTPTGVWERERCLATQRGHVAGSGTAISGEDGSGPPERTGATGNSTCANHTHTPKMVPLFVHRANAYRRHVQQDSNVVSNRRYRTKAVLHVYVAQLEIRIHLVLTRVHSRQRSTGLSCNSPLAMPSLPCAHQYILALHVDGSRMKKSSSPHPPPSVHRPPSSPLHVVRPLRPECPAECPASSLLPTSRCIVSTACI